MKIYNSEHKLGLSELILQNTTIALCSEILPCIPTDRDISIATTYATAENKNQLDLYYIDSILASTGWNKNDDVFDPAETWRAKSTPEDKQFNYMHDEKDIIGHITSSRISDYEGNAIANIELTNDIPNYFDIIVSSVLYTSWSSADLKARMKSIIDDIEGNKTWHVSMECLFPDFDYAISEPNGSTKIVKREESSAFLSKHLRAYGGRGEYNGYKVGRLLRSFSFSGIGLVQKPANPRSIILNSEKPKIFSISRSEEIHMTDELETLKASLAEATKINEDMKKQLDEAKAQKAVAEEAVKNSEKTIAETKDALAAVNTEKDKMADEMKKMKDKAAMTEEEMNKMKKEKMAMKRKAELVEAGLEDSEIEETFAKFENLEDVAFEAVVATMKTMKAKFSNKKDDKAKMDNKAVCSQDDDNVDDSALDTAVASKDIAMADSNDNEEEDVKIQAFASEYFGQFLKSTAKLK